MAQCHCLAYDHLQRYVPPREAHIFRKESDESLAFPMTLCKVPDSCPSGCRGWEGDGDEEEGEEEVEGGGNDDDDDEEEEMDVALLFPPNTSYIFSPHSEICISISLLLSTGRVKMKRKSNLLRNNRLIKHL